MKKVIKTMNAPHPLGPYNQAIEAGGFLFVSGQLPIDPVTGKIIGDNMAAQTHQVMQNIKAILNAANYDLNDIVQSTVYLSAMAFFEDFNKEYAKYFQLDFPARLTVGGAELKSGAFIEVAIIAYKEQQGLTSYKKQSTLTKIQA